MFVDEKAEGEPYRPEKPYRLPNGFFAAILLSLAVAIFCHTIGVSYAMQREPDAVSAMADIGNLFIALTLATMLVAAILMRAARTGDRVPPF